MIFNEAFDELISYLLKENIDFKFRFDNPQFKLDVKLENLNDNFNIFNTPTDDIVLMYMDLEIIRDKNCKKIIKKIEDNL